MKIYYNKFVLTSNLEGIYIYYGWFDFHHQLEWLHHTSLKLKILPAECRVPLLVVYDTITLCVSAVGFAKAFVQGIEKIGPRYVDRLEYNDHYLFQPCQSVHSFLMNKTKGKRRSLV